MKILFQGDSITDMHRNRADIHNLGEGYPLYAAAFMRELYPDMDFEFIDLAYSGNRTYDLVNRLERDFISIQPDIVSILIGINDVWTPYKHGTPVDSDDDFEARYRTVLKEIKEKTHAKILMLEPFLGPIEIAGCMRWDLNNKIDRIRKLAREYADWYIPLDGLLAQAYVNDDHLKYSADGVHPISYGAEFIGKIYAEQISHLF